MIVTIDGPAGAGKSSAAKALARRLGFHFLDTGAMYRAVALAGLEANVAWHDPAAVARMAASLTLELTDTTVRLNGRDVTTDIRTSQVADLTKFTAGNPHVRAQLVDLQRQAVRGGDFVTEGRDQGTVAFPDAECKIFLTASPEERARRRHADLTDRGEQVSFAEVLSAQNERDERDRTRAVGPLVPAADAVHVLTDGLSPEAVVDRLAEVVAAARHRHARPVH